MSAGTHQTAAQIRSRLDHPVIDGDGHWVEFDPVFSERMRKVGGDLAAEGFLAALKTTQDALSMSLAERRRRRVAQPGFWTRQAGNTLDRATAMMPRLLYERLDEFGSDFAIIYPTAGLRVPRISDDATRRAVVRAHNVVTADYFRNLSDQMTPAPRKRPLSPEARRALKLPASNSRGFTEGFAAAAPRLGEREPGSLAGSRASIPIGGRKGEKQAVMLSMRQSFSIF